MRKTTPFSLTALGLALCAGPCLLAQVTTGALSGRILDERGKPIHGARVTLESPALFQPKTLFTDASGVYRGQMLPVGNYVLKVGAQGYLGKSALGVRVGLGQNLTFDFTLHSVKEEGAIVEVVGQVVQASKTDDKVATNFSAEDLIKLPSDRSFGGAAQLAPGVTGGGDGAYNIRGGSTAGQSNRGGGFEQVNFTVDGIDVKDDTGNGGRHTVFDPLPDSVEDIQVVQSQLNARYGRTTGGAINIATKSGSNDWAGTVRAYVNRPSWTTNLPHGSAAGIADAESSRGDGYSRYTDVTLGGPIIKDRIWFFLGARIQPSASGTARLGWGTPARMQQSTDNGSSWTDMAGNWESYFKYPMITWGLYPGVDNVLRGGVDTSGAPVSGVAGYPTGYGSPDLTQSDNGKIVPTSSRYTHWQGKITAQINADNIVNATYLYGKTTDEGMTGQFSSGLGEATNLAFVGKGVTRTQAYTLNWNSTLASNWFLEAKVSKAELDSYDVQGPTTYPTFVFSLLSTGDPFKRLFAGDDPQSYAGSGGRSAYFGPFDTLRMSSSVTPSVVENLTYTFNLKTFQDAAGSHEIDFGAEFFQTADQFGRERNGNYGVMEGGYITKPGGSLLDADSYLFPTFYNTNNTPLVPETAYGPDDNMTLWQQIIYGPSAHIEQYTVGGARSRNNSSAVWLNDTWSLSEKFNVMLGLRYNKFLVHDTNGRTQCDNSITEPRFQAKWNPDGKNREVYSFTLAKLASRYSDDFASFFRTNGWTSRVVRAWNGAAWSAAHPGEAQETVDSAVAASDPMAGVRWVSYADLINPDNYNTIPEQVVALDQTMRTRGLQVPYVVEGTLGYTRNYDSGFIRFQVVSRTFRKDWVSGAHDGMYDPSNPYRYLTLVTNPVTGKPFSWNQTQLYMNSDQHRDYKGVEVSWNDKLTRHLTFGGSFTYAVEHGIASEMDYYNFRDEKLKLPLSQSVWCPTDALLSRSHMLNVHFTYEVPVGRGNVSASILAKLYNNGLRSLAGTSAMWDAVNPYSTLAYNANGTTVNLPVFAIDSVASTTGTSSPRYHTYLGGLNAFSSNYNDNLDIAMKLQGELPITSHLMLVAEIEIDNPFNRINKNHIYDWGSDVAADWTGENTPIVGRPLSQFSIHPWGYAGDSSYYDSGRTWSLNIGLKF
jgi:hypothetical protein